MGDGRPLAADFHALRHTCGVLAERGGASPLEVMALMRHTDRKLSPISPMCPIQGRTQHRRRGPPTDVADQSIGPST